jgi:monoamine oxidase
MGLTRRAFLTRIGQLGGATALYETVAALGLVNTFPAWADPPQLQENQGFGQSVLILGAGIGGLTTAYLLSRYGYLCHILEATTRAGGRNRTARRGDIISEITREGVTHQRCDFDEGLYINLGPGRIPHHHTRVLSYCQELRVELQPYIMNTSSNLFQTSKAFNNAPQIYRAMQNDTGGYIADLLAKAIHRNALDKELTPSDKKQLLSLLEKFGALDQSRYQGSSRDGCLPPTPNVKDSCQRPDTLALRELLNSGFWNTGFYSPSEFHWQPTLFQPVGGMDKIVEGFLRKVGHLVTYNAPVVNIHQDNASVTIQYRQGNDILTEKADYCVSNIPCPILKDIPGVNKFSKEYQTAILGTVFSPACKVGWQCNERFWESRYHIYGGISWTDDAIGQIWYPSNDFFRQKGTLVGAYMYGQTARDFGEYDLRLRLEKASQGGAKLHKEFNDNGVIPKTLGLSIAWQNVPYQNGAWPTRFEGKGSSDQVNYDKSVYKTLLNPDGRFYIVGDQVSTLPGWQEGAIMSAEHVVEQIGHVKPITASTA